VTNQGHDRAQLANMATQAQAVLDTQEITVVADRGYYSGEEIKTCDEAGIKTYLPKPQTSSNQARGYFGKRDFIYHPKDDEYQCTTGKNRRISRWEHESILDALETRMERSPDMMKVRRSTVEHPFGTIKYWMGSTHFQMRTIKRVSAEMSLHVLAYNLKRVIKILGTKQLIEAIQA